MYKWGKGKTREFSPSNYYLKGAMQHKGRELKCPDSNGEAARKTGKRHERDQY